MSAGVFNHELQVVRHLDQVLRFVRDLAQGEAVNPREATARRTPARRST
jgi:hypothetical protein